MSKNGILRRSEDQFFVQNLKSYKKLQIGDFSVTFSVKQRLSL